MASTLRLVNLDHTTLKNDFITWMQSQEQYKDYNFAGSNLNVLLDVLAYNTWKMGFYVNMAASEGFVDSAQLRESLFSHSKDLNYLPRSMKSSKASVSITFQASGDTQPYVFEKGSTFSTIVKNNSYFFSVDEDTSITSPNTTFTVAMDIYEGVYVQDTYIMDYSQESIRFRITNENVDTSSVRVLVYEDENEIPTVFTLATTLLDLNENSDVFFLQGSSNADYEILFGDDVLGRKPADSSVIVIDYRITNGPKADGATRFTMDFDPTGGEMTSAPVVTTVAISGDGADAESNESIRYYAPRHFQTQERAITSRDYEILLKTQFPEIGAISVFGGEDADPPRYGKVFVAIDLSNIEGLPNSKKLEYYSFLKSRSPLSVDPIFIEPSFTYVQIISKVKYNINTTSRTPQNLRADIINTILEYADENLNDFNSTLRFSKLLGAIDATDSSIIGNETALKVYKKIIPVLGTGQNIVVDFGFPLDDHGIHQIATGARHHSEIEAVIETSPFRFAGETVFVEDDGTGFLRYTKRIGNEDISMGTVGTYDAKKGLIKFSNLEVEDFQGTSIKVYGTTPESKDVASVKNTILAVEPDEVKVTVEVVRE